MTKSLKASCIAGSAAVLASVTHPGREVELQFGIEAVSFYGNALSGVDSFTTLSTKTSPTALSSSVSYRSLIAEVLASNKATILNFKYILFVYIYIRIITIIFIYIIK